MHDYATGLHKKIGKKKRTKWNHTCATTLLITPLNLNGIQVSS